MLQDTLCRHPQIAYIDNSMNRFPDVFCATDHFRKLLRLDFEVERYLADSVPVSPASPSDAVSFWSNWFRMDPFSMEYQEVTPADFSTEDRAGIDETIRKVLWCYGDPSKRFFNKVIPLSTYVDTLQDLFPDARIIHIVRDPRMTANSMVKLCKLEIEHQKEFKLYRLDPEKGEEYFIPYPRFPRLPEYVAEYGLTDLRTTAHIWQEVVNRVEESRPRVPHFYEVRYEDLLEEPRAELARLLEFCELPEVPEDNDHYWGKVNTIGSIKHKREYKDFGIVEEICSDGMQRFGYEKVGAAA